MNKEKGNIFDYVSSTKTPHFAGTVFIAGSKADVSLNNDVSFITPSSR